ncbi:sulfatase family protein [Mucilaginibacter dorajii]|nr:sulfatase [Mucilaginibacter dorajii]MCS3732230.1 arylsulfatase A-like enzyme [Mucilaginibacter dorajii]
MKNSISAILKKLFIVIGLFTGSLSSFAQNSAQRPNVVLILSDDHSSIFMGAYGNKDVKTPHLDQLAQEGMRFTNAFTTSPQCTPSRASLMTGRAPVDIRMSRFANTLPRDIITYPEILRKAGYYTGICGRNYHLDGSGTSPETEAVFKKYNLRTFKDRVDYVKIGGNFTALPEMKEILDQKPPDKPFFIQVSYNDPHYPYNAYTFEPDSSKIKMPAGMVDLPEVRKHVAGHMGEISRMDSLAGQVIAELKARKLYQNTIIIFMGDNGSAVLRGKGTLYDLGLHVPLIIKWDGHIKGGSVSNTLISGEDIAPTILDMTGAAVPPTFTGKSFKGAFNNPSFENYDHIYAERGAHGTRLPNSTFDFDLSRTVFSKKYKLIYNALWQLPYTPVDFDEGPAWKKIKALHQAGKLEQPYERLYFNNGNERPMFEFYDLEKDPLEMNNLNDDPAYKDAEHTYKTYLNEWMILQQDYIPLPLPPAPVK